MYFYVCDSLCTYRLSRIAITKIIMAMINSHRATTDTTKTAIQQYKARI